MPEANALERWTRPTCFMYISHELLHPASEFIRVLTLPLLCLPEILTLPLNSLLEDFNVGPQLGVFAQALYHMSGLYMRSSNPVPEEIWSYKTDPEYRSSKSYLALVVKGWLCARLGEALGQDALSLCLCEKKQSIRENKYLVEKI